ncbi:TTF2 family protein [Megaselia abdita]
MSVVKKRIFKEKWFYEKCEIARRNSFKCFNLMRRNYNSDFFRQLYTIMNRNYKVICRISREKYFKEKAQQLRSIKSSKDWWSWLIVISSSDEMEEINPSDDLNSSDDMESDEDEFYHSHRFHRRPTFRSSSSHATENIETPSSDFLSQISDLLDIPSWNDLANGVRNMRSKHKGEQGLATFNLQKALTMNALKNIHGSLNGLPSESALSEDPRGLKVNLMEHQKHALAWMLWRENQKPKGGILADDMGLGKTLTMIALIVNSNERDSYRLHNGGNDSEDFWGEKETERRRDYFNGGTLVICPASIIHQWEREAKQRLHKDVLSVYVHHGSNRESKSRALCKFGMVVTTYNICAMEGKADGALFGVKWRRVILDEAHIVRNHKTHICIGVCKLEAESRWTLTGTPVQNKELDLYALIKFLRCAPFDDLSHWKIWIQRVGGHQRLNILMKSLMLRRTKVQLQEKGALPKLPNKETVLIDVELGKEEMTVYQSILAFSKSLFAQFLDQRANKRDNGGYYHYSRPTYKKGKDKKDDIYQKLYEQFVKKHAKGEIKTYVILVLLLRLRQLCCHPGLIDAMLEDDLEGCDGVDSKEDVGINMLKQLDSFGSDDEEEKQAKAMLLEMDDSAEVLKRGNPVFNLLRPSSKMMKVLSVFEERVESTGDKAIIISQWTGVLNILKTHFTVKGIPYLTLDGKVPVKDRQDIVDKINDPKSETRVLFLSLTAGGVGLNLIGANHLFLFDLHWNPQLEAQAQDRIYRVGQKKDVFVYKFMCTGTVEERIKALQDIKLSIAERVLTGSRSVGNRLTIEDLKLLFEM